MLPLFRFRLALHMRYVFDLLKESAWLSDVVALVDVAASLASGKGRRRARLMHAARMARGSLVRSLVRGRLRPLIRTATAAPTRSSAPRQTTGVPFTLILKAPGEGSEKGVLFSTVESAWKALTAHPRARDILDRYTFVGVSAWSPANYKRFLEFAPITDDSVHICVSNQDDLGAYEMFAPLVRGLPMMAGDWLNPADFEPRARTARDIDIIMVAGWGRYKRHWLLFEALKRMRPDLNVVLVGADSGGRTWKDISKEAAMIGVKQEVRFVHNVPVREVYDLLARSRVKVLCSGREGACVAVTEALFANTPVAMMASARVGSRAHINEATGVLLRRRTMARQLDRFLDRAESLEPRLWAEERISCHASSRRLAEALKRESQRQGRGWTSNPSPVFWRHFRPHYLHPEDAHRLQEAYRDMESEYGIVLTEAAVGAESGGSSSEAD